MMSGDVRVVGTKLVTNVDAHLKVVGPADGPSAKQAREAGLQLIDQPSDTVSDANASTTQTSFVPLDRIPALVRLQPTFNSTIPSRSPFCPFLSSNGQNVAYYSLKSLQISNSKSSMPAAGMCALFLLIPLNYLHSDSLLLL